VSTLPLPSPYLFKVFLRQVSMLKLGGAMLAFLFDAVDFGLDISTVIFSKFRLVFRMSSYNCLMS
jgi:hypothetical protein